MEIKELLKQLTKDQLIELKEEINDLLLSISSVPCCPHCGSTSYVVNYMTTTALAVSHYFENGVEHIHNPNTSTCNCTCSNCGEAFSYNTSE